MAAIGYFVHFVSRTIGRVEVADLVSSPAIGAILLVALATVASIATTGWAWGRLLGERRVLVPNRQLMMILGLTQIAKYLPGNIGHHLARAVVAYRHGIPASDLATTVALEAGLTIAAAVAVGAVGYGIAVEPLIALLVIGISMLALRYLGSARRAALLAYTFNFVMVGTGLYLIAVAVTPSPLSTMPTFVGAFALAWVAGFVVPGAPAGLGVREGLLVGMLTPTLGSANVLVVVLGFRVATTVGDLISFGAGSVLALHQPRDELVGSGSDSEM